MEIELQISNIAIIFNTDYLKITNYGFFGGNRLNKPGEGDTAGKPSTPFYS